VHPQLAVHTLKPFDNPSHRRADPAKKRSNVVVWNVRADGSVVDVETQVFYRLCVWLPEYF
jgi:hypothetical protein